MLLPSWDALAAMAPSASKHTPRSIDWVLTPGMAFSGTRPTLFRERNGWCPYSARAWLALELLGIEYDTVRIDTSFNGRPASMTAATPQIRWADGSLLSGSLDILRELDRFPQSTLWSVPGTEPCEIEALALAYHCIFPGSGRACDGEPMRLSSSRAVFEDAIRQTDELLARRPDGPFFCGRSLSAADVAWAPFLERYAAWLPLLHPGLQMAGAEAAATSPHLFRWFEAMAALPPYTCRLRGDAASWWKVLAFSPGWLVVANRGWKPPPLAATRPSANGVSGGAPRLGVRDSQWEEYAERRPHVGRCVGRETAAHLIRHREAVARDACRGMGLGGDLAAVDSPLRALVWLLADASGADEAGARNTEGLRPLLAYLDERVCVPRDVGAPVAAALSQLLVDV